MGNWIANNFNLIIVIWVGFAFLYELHETIAKWKYSNDKPGLVSSLVFKTLGSVVIVAIILVVLLFAIDAFYSGEDFCWHPSC